MHWLENRSQLSPNEWAMEIDGESVSFLELHKRALIRCAGFQKLGIKKGDIVALYGQNSVVLVECIFGLMYCGAVSLLLNTRLSEQEIQWQFKYSKAKYLFSDTELFIPFLYMRDVIGEKEEAMISPLQLKEPCTMMFTSGTTGQPKCAIHTYKNHYTSAIASLLNLGKQKKDVWLSTLPFYHVGGFSMLMKCVIYGMPIVSASSYHSYGLAQMIEDSKANMASLVTKMVKDLLETEKGTKALQQLRCVLVGGGPISEALVALCEEKQIALYQTYGMTETASQIVTIGLEDLGIKGKSVGKPLFGCQVKIIADEKSGAEGEIAVKGDNLFKGYLYSNGEEFEDGWFRTGDIGYFDEEGYLYICDRRKDLIISGGENIYPIEIEQVIGMYEGVKDVGVIGISSDKWGQRPVAVIQADGEVDVSRLYVHCQKYLARYKIPDRFHVTKEDLPRNSMNKLMRHELVRYVCED